MIALTYAVLAEPCVNKSPPSEFPKKSQTSRNFNFITWCLPENFLSLAIPGKIFRFLEELQFSPQTALLRVDTPWLVGCEDLVMYQNTVP